MPNAIDQLLGELDPLPYHERMRRVAGVSRTLAAAGTLDDVLTGLRDGDRYQRHLALTMALATRNGAAARVALSDPDQSIRALAVAACLRAGWLGGADLVSLMTDAPAQLRLLVYRLLGRGPYAGHADALVELVRGRYGDREAARLLPACDAATVERLLPELDHAIGNWTALARRHRELVLRYAVGVLDPLDAAEREQWWGRCGISLLVVAAEDPYPVLDLLERFGPSTYLPGNLARYGVLAAADPHRVVRLLTAPARAPWLLRQRWPTALLDRLGRLDPADLSVLADRLRGRDTAFARLLEAVPPGRRGTLYDAATANVETGPLILDETVLAVLPRRWQHREARRILALPPIRADEAMTLRYTAYLPWPEAAPVLTAATTRAMADERATGYTLLLAAAGRSADPAAVAAVVDHLLRLRNEQDPVRAQALQALSRLPRLLTAGSVETLSRIVADTTEARDSSMASLGALSQLAVSVVGHHPDQPALLSWAWQTFDRLFHGASVPRLGRLDTRLRRGQEQAFFATVRSWLEATMARGNFQPMLTVTSALGRRAWALPELQLLLRQAIRPDIVSTVFRTATRLWLDDPATRSDRVAEVLRVDTSTVTLTEVWQVVAARRTDLLDLVLLGTPPTGRFLSAGARWLPGSARYVERWRPRHQRALIELLAASAADAGSPVHSRVNAIAIAGRVPEHGWSLVQRYLDSPEVNLAEAALGSLPWTDRPADALPILLTRVDGDRARVAVYAAGRAVRFVAPSQLPVLLGGVATGRGKVTSRKETIQLLARFGPPEAMELLLEAWRQEGQHRDVRAAIVSAARLRLDLPQSWRIIEEAATGGREELRTLLTTTPQAMAEPARRRFATLVVRACGQADRVVARNAWYHLSHWAPWTPDLLTTVVTAVSDLDDEQVWPAVARALAELLDHQPGTGTGTARLLDAALAALVRLDRDDADPGGPATDRPARRRIDLLVEQTIDWAEHAGPEADRESIREAARSLAGQPEFESQGAALLLALARLDASGPDDLVAQLTEVAGLLVDRPALAGLLAGRLVDRVSAGGGNQMASTLAAAADRLTADGGVTTGLFAVGLTRAGAGDGWPQPWPSLLHRLRRHPAPDVRSAAFEVVMA